MYSLPRRITIRGETFERRWRRGSENGLLLRHIRVAVPLLRNLRSNKKSGCEERRVEWRSHWIQIQLP